MPSFEDLIIWQKTHKLMLRIHEIASRLPKEERFGVGGQIKRSSSSVSDNIAEGYGSYYYNDKIKKFYVSRGEATETQNHLRSLEGKGCLKSEETNELVTEYTGVIKGINGYVNYIRRKRKDNR
ncbi:MAG: four helix bundle protein [Planctomycetes bacterium]|nr:four helix bundle protein [Planctomycetota bacterium]